MARQRARANFTLGDEYVGLLRAITKQTRRSMTEELRLMLDARAITMGLEPIRPVDPKPLPSARELTREMA